MEVCTYQSVACSTTMWGGEDSSTFCYMRPTDASSVLVYVRRTPSELPSARDRQPADLTYIHGPWSRRPEESERARETYRTHAPQNTSLVPTTHSQPNTSSSSSKCRKQQAFFRIIILVSYLIFRLEMGTNRREDQERNI